ncbi:hypothetical protein ELQ35_13655 [Peribacillus cavernae]|uniref:Uncharacterized protein n=1 Tax=Peribacillus cavernae TaxID=1674310 RepID=A0A3S0W5P0_9BACI|nr:hypothetical protein [Peribacillus cavernae]MDQ0217822.1 hypothetical protein [Peribacillus cavernae]RUQ28270.1 hypothetical protein ELQ35_13655 [Peribacillus cavernae]
MKIDISKQQYERLVKLMEYGMWVVDSENPDSPNNDYRELEQAILAHAEDFQFGHIIHNSEQNLLEPAPVLQNEIFQVLDSYEDMVFWDKFVYYMARKDIDKENQSYHYSEEEYLERLMELEEQYHQHFESFGIAKVKVEE